MGITLPRRAKKLKEDPRYQFNPETGYFEIKQSKVRGWIHTIETDTPELDAKILFSKLTEGAHIAEKIPGHLWTAHLNDGTIISLRIDYPPGHASAVEINIKNCEDPAGIKNQKIHFSKPKEKK